ncbi:hypothetical protein GUJ93_ZPchr0006g44890 [Zizania palustris]|uniref:Calcineurin-like phosphoesterase domain-containing protein n=1 Tax=Zizania palustris TaxID=103762 RepID=A0A8J5SR55_ZIZPA|nr:hypothetical protein GUJ93_ZPchr0006g44890 [Zizania palustris]
MSTTTTTHGNGWRPVPAAYRGSAEHVTAQHVRGNPIAVLVHLIVIVVFALRLAVAHQAPPCGVRLGAHSSSSRHPTTPRRRRDSPPRGADPDSVRLRAMDSELGSPFVLLLLLLFLPPLCAPWPAADDEAAVARSTFPMDGDVAWVVQVSDLHISAYHPDRADDLASLLGPALRAIRPHLLLVTGDITVIS